MSNLENNPMPTPVVMGIATPSIPVPSGPLCGATCDWEWNGTKWVNLYNDCVAPCRCFYPTGTGTNVGELTSTNCTDVPFNPDYWNSPTPIPNPNNVPLGGCEGCQMEAYRVGSKDGPIAVRTVKDNCKPQGMANPNCKCADAAKYLFSTGQGSQWTSYFPLITQELYPNGVAFNVGCDVGASPSQPLPPSSGMVTLCPEKSCTLQWFSTFTNPQNYYELTNGQWNVISNNCGLSCKCDIPKKFGAWPTETVTVRCILNDANAVPIPANEDLNNLQKQRSFYMEQKTQDGAKVIADSSKFSEFTEVPNLPNSMPMRKISTDNAE